MTPRTRLTTFAVLSAGVFLGFYLFGLVMGVYSPGDVLYFTIPAVVAVILLVLYVVRARRAPSPGADDPLTRTTRHLRETRGF